MNDFRPQKFPICLAILASIIIYDGCTPTQQNPANSQKQNTDQHPIDMKKQRMENVWKDQTIQSFLDGPYSRLIEVLGKPDDEYWNNPGFGFVFYDSLKIWSSDNGNTRLARILRFQIKNYQVVPPIVE
jgi:hypothetical protein